MKVLIATGLYAPEIGGPATHTAILEHELPALATEVVVVPFAKVRKYPKVVRHIVYCASLLSHMKGVSIVYALDPVSVGLPAFIAARLSGKTFVLRVAGDYAWEQAVGRYGTKLFLDQFVMRIKKQSLPVRVLASVERFVAKQAARVVVPSEYLKRIVVAWGVPESRIQVVYNAFTPPAVPFSREAARARFGLTGIVVASAGRMVPWKGFRTLIDAIADARAEEPNINCVIVGDGPEYSALAAHVKERKLEENVRFLAPLPKADFVAFMSGVDIFVLNTAYEGFSHQLLEIMALGVPVITTDVGGNSELIEHEKTGLFVPYDEVHSIARSILRLAQHASVVTTLSNAARERAASFTTKRMLEGVKSVFDAVTT